MAVILGTILTNTNYFGGHFETNLNPIFALL